MENILMTENLVSNIYDILIDNKDAFLTVDNIYDNIVHEKPHYMSNNEFYSNVASACTTTCDTYNNIHKMYKRVNFFPVPVFTFSTKTPNELYNKLCNYELHSCNVDKYNTYDEKLNYLDEISRNTSVYSDFNPNNAMYENSYPLEFLASCKPTDNQKCIDITEKLFMNYDNIILTPENFTLAKHNNNTQFLNICYKKQIDDHNKTIAALKYKLNRLQAEYANRGNNHENISIIPHLFVIFVSFAIFMIIMIINFSFV